MIQTSRLGNFGTTRDDYSGGAGNSQY